MYNPISCSVGDTNPSVMYEWSIKFFTWFNCLNIGLLLHVLGLDQYAYLGNAFPADETYFYVHSLLDTDTDILLEE